MLRSVLVLVLALAPVVADAAPTAVSHNGRLLDAAGGPVNGAHTISFGLWDAQTDGTSSWSGSAELNLQDGYYSVMLGSAPMPVLDASVLTSDDLWLQVSVGGDAMPRTPLGSVPFALEAFSVGGGPVDASEIRVNGNVVVDSSGAITGGSAVEILGGDDPRISYSPAVSDSCGAGAWCTSGGWGQNRLSTSARYTHCNGETDCSAYSATLALDDNTTRSVMMSNLDWSDSRYFDVFLSFNGGSNYTFHKRVRTRRSVATTPYTSQIRTVASNLPLGADIRVRLVATRGRMHFEGFALSQDILPEAVDLPHYEPHVHRFKVQDGNEYNNWTRLSYSAFTFHKQDGHTRLQVTYNDSIRTLGGSGGGGCGWEVRIDGAPCTPNPLLAVQHHNASHPADIHMSTTVVGVCEGVGAGAREVAIWQKRRDNDEDCYRGHAISLSSNGPVDQYSTTIIVQEMP